MTISKTTNHVQEAVQHFVEQFKDKAVLSAVITALVNQIQELEGVAFQLDLGTADSLRTLDNAEGTQLDGRGAIVGEARQDRDDDTYRKAIRTRELINRSSGTGPEILEIFNRFREGTYQIKEDYPASFRLIAQEAITPSDPHPTEFAKLLDNIKAAGVGSSFVYGGYDIEYMFKFASGDALESSSVYGFGGDV